MQQSIAQHATCVSEVVALGKILLQVLSTPLPL
jgi:hypothetical protein